jgi:cytochrome c peroxidase
MTKFLPLTALGLFAALCFCVFVACNKDSAPEVTQSAVEKTFNGKIDLNNLYAYAGQSVPGFITKDNSTGNTITDKGATLGRVLFYDKSLSVNNTVSCGSCHRQEFAFSDTSVASKGVNGTTGRHSMRLVNARFGQEGKFFWDERAATLEDQTTQPIKDHSEMGFSGKNGDPSINDLITKLKAVDYYKELFTFAYGTDEITEQKMKLALAQFVRSISSFDSKYDAGRALVPNDGANFSNFTAQENNGKNIFLTPPQFNASGVRIGGGLGCAGCHRPPEFDIDPNSRSNGIAGSINGGGPDFTNTRSPSLRNLVRIDGTVNGPMMHTGVIKDLQTAIGHYGNLTAQAINNPNLDPRLKPNGIGQQLNVTTPEVNSVVAFLRTLSGTDVYTNPKWSDPFQ